MSRSLRYRDGVFGDELTDIGPASTVAAMEDAEVGVLRQVGDHWNRALGPRPDWLRALPIDPAVHRFPRSLEAGRAGRFAPIDFVETDDENEIVATPHASSAGRAAPTLRRVLLGALNGSAVAHERMRKSVALPILSSDALSSVAYGPEAMLAVLALAGSGALGLSLGLSAAIVVLMGGGEPLLPPADTGLPARRRVLHRRGQETSASCRT
jgi:hypothetical protein